MGDGDSKPLLKIEFTEKQARRQIMEELIRKNGEGQSLLNQIGIEGLYNKSYGSLLYDKAYCQEPEQFNIMLKPKFRANFRAGYWEVVFFHTKPLEVYRWKCGHDKWKSSYGRNQIAAALFFVY